jgi:type 1 fimbria pilin
LSGKRRRRWVVAIAAIGAAVAGSLAFSLAAGGDSGPETTIVRNGEVWLQGEITQDTCDSFETHIPIGDAGCSITVNGYEVSIVHGNARLIRTPGTVTGLDVLTDQSGRHADVYAQLTGPHSASILNAPKYYARISG